MDEQNTDQPEAASAGTKVDEDSPISDPSQPAEQTPDTSEQKDGMEKEADLCDIQIPDSIPQVDKAIIDSLTYGVLAHFLPEMQKAKSTLAELTENQRILIETVQQENAKFGESQALTEVTEIMDKAKQYHTKLVNIKKEMVILHDKSAKLKKRAVKLQQQKQKEALQREQEREREAEKERQLTAKFAKPTAGIM